MAPIFVSLAGASAELKASRFYVGVEGIVAVVVIVVMILGILC